MDEHYNHHHHTAPHKHLVRYFRDNLAIVVGLVLIWRGVWYILDGLDYYLWGDPSHIASAIIGTIIGVLILYLPDRDLKELQKL